MSKAFASQADLEDKKITFEQLSPHCWAYTAEGDPNSGVIIGDDFIMVSDATATPAMARDLIKQIRTVSDKPIKYVLLTHYHAVRVLGASAYFAEGATEIIASQGTLELIRERGAQDMQSEMERFPRLFRGADSVPGLTWPSMVIGGGDPTKGEKPGKLSINLGGVVVQIWSPGYGHTRGDTIAWVEEEKVLFSGDLVEYEAGVYTGDAQLEEWPATLEALRALNAEFIAPFPGAGNDRTLRLFGFFDIGNVYTEDQKVDLGELRASVGVGLSWVSPLGPLRLALAKPIRKKPGDKMQTIQFQIGTSF